MKKINLKLLMVIVTVMPGIKMQAQIGIGTTSPNASAALDVTSANSGVLIPRVSLLSNTDAITIPSPATSLLVYNTGFAPNGYYFWNGSTWSQLAVSAPSTDWSLLGNTGTTPGTNYLGTSDAVDIRFKTGATDRWNISHTNNGQLQSYSLGTAATPSYSFQTDQNTGIFSSGADALDISTGGMSRFRIPNTNQVHALSLGTAASPFYSFSGQATTGIFGVATDNLAFSTAATERMRIESDGDVGIGATPNASARLEINATNRGLLIPNVALTAKNVAGPIAAPATSLLVYNTATAGVSPNNVVPGYYYWNGAAWVGFTGSNSNDWSITGNTGTGAANYVGTADAVDLKISTNGTERMRVLSNGQVVVNNTAVPPASDRFSVYNTTTSDYAINGYSTLTGVGVYGQNTGTGIAVRGTNTSTGYGVYGTTAGSTSAGVGGVANVANGAGVYGTSNGTGGLGVFGNGSNSTSSGVYGQSTGANGIGIEGYANNTSGYGAYGESAGTNGVGVFGYASAAGGDGVYGQATQPARYGVWGVNNNATGIGVYGSSTGSDATSVFGSATGTNADGVYGQATGATGYGVWGVNNNATGNGVVGTSSGNTANGVFGSVSGTGGNGVFGSATGASGYGVYGVNNNTTGNGVVGASTGANGTGVFGTTTGSDATGVWGTSTGLNADGVYGQASGANGNGVWGVNNNATGTGVYGSTTGTTGTAVWGNATGTSADAVYGSASGAGGFGVFGLNSNAVGTGVVGAGNNVTASYSAGGSGGAFTGAAFGTLSYSTAAASGVGIAAAGNNAAITSFDGNGAGGAFTGNRWGTTSIATITGAANDGIDRAVLAGTYISGGSTSDVVYVGARIGGVNYKVLGTGGGSVSTTMKTSQGEKILFAPEAPENWFFDIGEVTLVNGVAKVHLDPTFVETISDAKPFKVFVQGGENTLGSIRITRNQKEKYFVLEDLGGPSNGTVQYNIYAIWKGKENVRFPELKEESRPKSIQNSSVSADANANNKASIQLSREANTPALKAENNAKPFDIKFNEKQNNKLNQTTVGKEVKIATATENHNIPAKSSSRAPRQTPSEVEVPAEKLK